MCSVLLIATLALFVQAAAQPGRVAPSLLEARERELTNLLQTRLQNNQAEQQVGNVRFFLGKGANEENKPAATTTAQALNVPANTDVISPQFWHSAANIINSAGMSTPQPSAASINAPPKPPTPMPWQAVFEQPQQPLDTKLGGEIMYKLSGGVTPTPPPTQAAISSQFVAQCPMVLFEKNLSVRAATCGATMGNWIDPSVMNPRTVLRWYPLPASGIFMGVDSSMTGPGSVKFAEITQELTLTGYSFVMKNCLGITRWQLEENVYKVDSMGQVSSTLELHDVTTNSAAYFLKYVIRWPTGVIAAESNLFRMMTNQVNFTEFTVVDGRPYNTGKVIAVVTRQGMWTQKGWEECMSPTSPRGWSLYFPQDQKSHDTIATVQDIRVAITGAITLMGYRNENRGANGLNTEGAVRQELTFVGGVALVLVLIVFACNFCMVFSSSGLKAKLKKTLFDSEGALLPKSPHVLRTPPMHATY